MIMHIEINRVGLNIGNVNNNVIGIALVMLVAYLSETNSYWFQEERYLASC